MFSMISLATMGWLCNFIAMSGVIGSCRGNVIMYPVNSSAQSFEDRPATFGIIISDNGLSGELVLANPLNACIPIQEAPKNFDVGRQYFALIKESDCEFGTQVLHAQNAYYEAAIIFSKDSDELKVMGGGRGRWSEGQHSKCVVGQLAGFILQKYTYKTGTSILITAFTGPPLLIYLVPFVIVVGLCFLFMAIFTIIRYYRHRVRIRRSRLTPANLKKIPCKKFVKGEEYDVCAICLDDYEEGDKLRVLPCEHVYHCKCVDPWLLEGKRTCPVCKQPVQPDKRKRRNRSRRSYSSVRSDSDDEHSDHREARGEEENENNVTVDERTPLIRGSQTQRPSAPTLNV